MLGSAGAGSAATASPLLMARPVFCVRALGLSKVLCSMDTINSYGAEAAEVVFFWLGKETQQGGRFLGRFERWVSGVGFFWGGDWWECQVFWKTEAGEG